MAVKNYGIRDQWTNLDKLNNVDIKATENDGDIIITGDCTITIS